MYIVRLVQTGFEYIVFVTFHISSVFKKTSHKFPKVSTLKQSVRDCTLSIFIFIYSIIIKLIRFNIAIFCVHNVSKNLMGLLTI